MRCALQHSFTSSMAISSSVADALQPLHGVQYRGCTDKISSTDDSSSRCKHLPAVSQVRRWRSRSPPSDSVPMPCGARTRRLLNGFEFPVLGFGTWGLHNSQLHTSLGGALRAGYDLIDTSSAYGNEAAIGHVLRQTPNTGKVVVQSKIGPRHMGRHKAREVAMNSIKSLGRLDVLVIHWPGRSRKLRSETWKVLEDLYHEGLVQVIGVSNFLPGHIDELLADGATIMPMINQFELHLLCQNNTIVDYCRHKSIAVQSYSTLGGGPANGKTRLEHGTQILLGNAVVADIAKEVGTSCACVCLRWAIQMGFAVIPKSSSVEHVQDNAKVFDVKLTEDQMFRLSNLDQDHHFAWDPRSL